MEYTQMVDFIPVTWNVTRCRYVLDNPFFLEFLDRGKCLKSTIVTRLESFCNTEWFWWRFGVQIFCLKMIVLLRYVIFTMFSVSFNLTLYYFIKALLLLKWGKFELLCMIPITPYKTRHRCIHFLSFDWISC